MALPEDLVPHLERLRAEGDQPPPLFPIGESPRATGWPRPGRCDACGRAAEVYPSRRWRHLDGPCSWRSAFALDGVSNLRAVPVARFVHDESQTATRVPDLDSLGELG